MPKAKKIIAASLAVLAFAPASSAMAWGPERPTYTMDSPAPHATFNSITDNPTLGDERNFVRIKEKTEGATFGDEVKIEPGKEYEVYIGYHNDAATETNQTGVGIAQEVRVSTTFTGSIKAGETGTVTGVISAADSDPLKVWDEAIMTADTDVKLSYKANTATIYNGWEINGTVLPNELFTQHGTYLGVDQLNGIVFGCAEYSGHILYTIVAEGEDSETPPPTPDEFPKTGPAEAILAVAIVLGICGGVYYLYRSKKTLKKVTDSVSGNDGIDNNSNTPDNNAEQ